MHDADGQAGAVQCVSLRLCARWGESALRVKSRRDGSHDEFDESRRFAFGVTV